MLTLYHPSVLSSAKKEAKRGQSCPGSRSALPAAMSALFPSLPATGVGEGRIELDELNLIQTRLYIFIQESDKRTERPSRHY